MRILLSVMMLLLLPIQAFAGDITSVFKNADGSTFSISVRDLQHVRMDTAPDAYSLLSGEKLYMVSRDEDGQWSAMDMDQMAGMMGMIGGGTQDSSSYDSKYVNTGRTERIAGYTGKVYEVEVTENGKLVSRDEVVLSSHGDIERVSKGWMAIVKQMSSIMSLDMAEVIDESESHGYGGVLRYGDDMILQSVSKTSLSASYFALPAGTQQVDIQAPPQQNPSQQQGSTLENDADDVGDAVRDEAKQSTIDEARQGVRDVFNSIFD